MENLEIYLDYIGDDSYVYRYNYDNKKYYNTGICLKGNPGNPGRPGKDGKTPHIGTNGDWYIGDVDTGVKSYTRTKVVTQLPEPSEATKNQIYVAPALNPQEGDSYSEYVTVYKDGQYKWELLGTKIATMGASGNNHKGGLVPDTPSIAGTTKFLCEDGTWKVIDINSKEDVTTIVAPVNATDATLPVTSLTCEVSKYYRLDVPIETLAVTLPAMGVVTSVKTVVIYLTTGTTPDVTITAAGNKSVAFQDGFELEAGKTYKISALFDGSAWIVDALTIKLPPFFAKLTLNDGSVVELEGSGELTSAMISSYASTLASAEIGTLCTRIGSDAFEGCSLTSVTIPDSVTSVGSSAFYECSSLTNIVIPNSVTSIGEYAFSLCNSLTSVTIGNSVTSIGEGAFYCCSSLTSIVIPNSVTSIDQWAFGNCSDLTSIIIPDSVTSIGSYAFYGCSSLTSIDIPDNVTSIGDDAFGNCSDLTSINVNIGNTVYDSRNNCNAIIETETNTLVIGCKTTIIPNSVTSIGYGAFYQCSSLTSIDIPNSVTSIDQQAFWQCSSLTSITIPDSVTSIGDMAFIHCSGLTSIVSNVMTAPTIKNYTFQHIKTGGTLTVPSGSTGYDAWMSTGDYYLGKYGWTKVEQ